MSTPTNTDFREPCTEIVGIDHGPAPEPSSLVGGGEPGAVGPDLVAVAAALHRAPAPPAGSGGVDEQQAAAVRAARADPVGERPGEQLDRIASDGGQQPGSGTPGCPLPVTARGQPGHQGRVRRRVVEGGEVVRPGGAPSTWPSASRHNASRRSRASATSPALTTSAGSGPEPGPPREPEPGPSPGPSPSGSRLSSAQRTRSTGSCSTSKYAKEPGPRSAAAPDTARPDRTGTNCRPDAAATARRAPVAPAVRTVQAVRPAGIAPACPLPFRSCNHYKRFP